MQNPPPRLSCRRCTQRKLKCNKLVPCSSCEASRSYCEVVERPRKPRGRSSKRSSLAKTNSQNAVLLEDRLSKLESLIQTAAHSFHPAPISEESSAQTQISSETTSSIASGAPRTDTSSFVAPEFWSALTEGVAALRDTIEDSGRDDEVEDDADLEAEQQQQQVSSALSSLMLDRSDYKVFQSLDPGMAAGPNHHVLLNLYHTRVDVIYKIFHWPTVMNDLLQTPPPSLNDSTAAKPPNYSLQALQSAVFFLAYGSITAEESIEMKLGNRAYMLHHYQRSFEEILPKTGFLTSPTIVTLQAFVVYLVIIIPLVTVFMVIIILTGLPRLAYGSSLTAHPHGRSYPLQCVKPKPCVSVTRMKNTFRRLSLKFVGDSCS